MELSGTVLTYRFVVQLDETYYRAAWESLSRAKASRGHIEGVSGELASHEWYDYFVADDWGDEIDFSVVQDEHDLEEEDLTQVSEKEAELSGHILSYVECLAAVHIFAAAALEAHINSLAAEKLKGKSFAEFDKLSLTGKWLFFPKLMSVEGFDPGGEPFQSFSRLVNFRNRLIHAKSIRVSLAELLAGKTQLGLSLLSAGRSLVAAGDMVSTLASKLGIELRTGWALGHAV